MRRPVSRLMFSSWLSQHVVNNKKDQRSSMGVKQAWQGIKYGRAISFPLERSKQRWGRWVCFQPYKVRSPIDSGFRRSEERSSRQDPLYNRTYDFVCFAIGATLGDKTKSKVNEVLIQARVWNSADALALFHQRRLVFLTEAAVCGLRSEKVTVFH